MAPNDYVNARNKVIEIQRLQNGNARHNNTKSHHRFSVDGHVYIPSLMAVDGDDDSIRNVVVEMFQLSTDMATFHLKVQNIPGGNTNKLYHVSGISTDHPLSCTATGSRIPPESVLVRIFGGHGMINRDVETSTYAALAQQGIALQYYGRFGNGRLEEWCPRAHHLKVRELSIPKFSLGIARATGRLHSQFVVPPDLKEYHNAHASPTLWTQLDSWLDQALTSSFQTDTDTERAATLPLALLKDELLWLKQDVCKITTTTSTTTSTTTTSSKVAFCHNDLLAANILRCQPLDGGAETIQLIDFEYGGMNYAAYDIANHFNEFAGGTNAEDNATPDYSLFPSPSIQYDFCQAYLEACGDNDTDIQDLLMEIKGFVLANHLVWGLWAINQAATEGCEGFDYMQYGSCRIQRYFLEKEDWAAEQ